MNSGLAVCLRFTMDYEEPIAFLLFGKFMVNIRFLYYPMFPLFSYLMCVCEVGSVALRYLYFAIILQEGFYGLLLCSF
jgi:hypothetical protein